MNRLNLHGVIGESVTAQQVKAALAEMDQSLPLEVSIDSIGGSVIDGFSIYEAIETYAGPTKAIVQPTAFSIASYIACAFDTIEIVSNGYMMLHRPSWEASGDFENLQSSAEALKKFNESMVTAYSKRMGLSVAEVDEVLRKESYLTAEECVKSGLASKVIDKSVQSTSLPQAKLKDMPHRVFTALVGAGSAGDSKTKDVPMSDQKPVAATVQELKAALPKAKADFIVKCMERNLPLPKAMEEAANESMTEVETLMARITALETENAELKAKASAGCGTDGQATARKTGADPLARAAGAASGQAQPTATAKWNEAVNACMARCGNNKAKATAMANRENPGLRQKMIEEANG